MSERLSTPKSNFSPKVAAQRLEMCISEKNLTHKDGTPNASKVAEFTGLDRRTITKMLKAEETDSFNTDSFTLLAQKFDRPVGYLLGQHDFASQEEFDRHTTKVQEAAVADKRYRETEDRKALFRLFGYIYDIKGSSVFAQAGGNCIHKKHMIAPQNQLDQAIFLSEAELEKFMESISRQIRFSIFELRELQV